MLYNKNMAGKIRPKSGGYQISQNPIINQHRSRYLKKNFVDNLRQSQGQNPNTLSTSNLSDQIIIGNPARIKGMPKSGIQNRYGEYQIDSFNTSGVNQFGNRIKEKKRENIPHELNALINRSQSRIIQSRWDSLGTTAVDKDSRVNSTLN